MARQAFATWTLATSLRRDLTPLAADSLGGFIVGELGALGYSTAIMTTEMARSLRSTSLLGKKSIHGY